MINEPSWRYLVKCYTKHIACSQCSWWLWFIGLYICSNCCSNYWCVPATRPGWSTSRSCNICAKSWLHLPYMRFWSQHSAWKLRSFSTANAAPSPYFSNKMLQSQNHFNCLVKTMHGGLALIGIGYQLFFCCFPDFCEKETSSQNWRPVGTMLSLNCFSRYAGKMVLAVHLHTVSVVWDCTPQDLFHCMLLSWEKQCQKWAMKILVCQCAWCMHLSQCWYQSIFLHFLGPVLPGMSCIAQCPIGSVGSCGVAPVGRPMISHVDAKDDTQNGFQFHANRMH